jgi:hyperosmotically inducible periplasmic protein
MKQLMYVAVIATLMLAGAACDRTRDEVQTFGHEIESTGAAAEENVEKAAVATKAVTKKAARKTKRALDTAAGRTKTAVATTGETTKEGLNASGEAITDAWITTKVKADLYDEDALKAGDIDVETDNHVVTLSGTAPSAVARVRAWEIAKNIDGVTRVVNKMKIATK